MCDVVSSSALPRGVLSDRGLLIVGSWTPVDLILGQLVLLQHRRLPNT